MRNLMAAALCLALAACASHRPLPMQQAGVSIWDVSPGGASIRQSGGGSQYQFAVLSPEGRGIASMRLFDPSAQDVVFLFMDFKGLDNFVVAGQDSRFQCGSQRPESGLVYVCAWKGKTLKEARVQQKADGIAVSVPAELFKGGRTVRLEWLDFWR